MTTLKNIFFVVFLALILFTTSCSPKDEQPSEGIKIDQLPTDREIIVVTTTDVIADLVRNIANNRVKVTALMGPGINPQTYVVSKKDVSLIKHADILFYNGLNLEAKMTDLLEKLEGQLPLYPVSDGVAKTKLLTPPGKDRAFDPFIWHDVSLWMEATSYVKEVFVELNPTHKDYYNANFRQFMLGLAGLHKFVSEQSKTMSKKRRVILSNDNVFTYFGKIYDFDIVELNNYQTSPNNQSTRQNLTTFIAEKQIPAIFVNNVNPDIDLQYIKQLVHDKGLDIPIVENLYYYSMGKAGTPEGSYVGMTKHNILTIVAALHEQAT